MNEHKSRQDCKFQVPSTVHKGHRRGGNYVRQKFTFSCQMKALTFFNDVRENF